PSEEYEDVFYLILAVLTPLSADRVMRADAFGFDADWKGYAREMFPVVRDGDRLVYEHPVRGQIFLRVEKSTPRGGQQELFLFEIGAEQPTTNEETQPNPENPWG